MTAHHPTTTATSDTADGPPEDPDRRPELGDVRRVGRHLVGRLVTSARTAEQPTVRTLVAEHLGGRVDDLPVVGETWPAYEQVNLQGALDAWLAEPGRTHRVLGLADVRDREFGFTELLHRHERYGPRLGNVTRVALATGPGDATRDCLRSSVILVGDGEQRLAVLVREPMRHSEAFECSVEILCADPDVASAAAADLRRLVLELNVYRGQVVTFGRSLFGNRQSLLTFHPRPTVSVAEVVLPEETFADVRRQVVDVADNRDVLRAAGQHLKRGVLLYGPPGVGKTHTVRHLMSELTDTTVVVLTGETLSAIRQACSIARALQPSMIVVEDVDLIAEQRDHYSGETPLLFTLLNEMDGLADDADVVFLLTTNRADLLEPALAQRPGRVDQAVHIDVPDRDARRALVELYRGRLDLDTSRLDDVLDQTEGVTASFLKELLRRAAVRSAAGDGRPGPESAALRVGADDLAAALDDLLDTRNQMTRAVLGYDRPAADPPAPHP